MRLSWSNTYLEDVSTIDSDAELFGDVSVAILCQELQRRFVYFLKHIQRASSPEQSSILVPHPRSDALGRHHLKGGLVEVMTRNTRNHIISLCACNDRMQ